MSACSGQAPAADEARPGALGVEAREVAAGGATPTQTTPIGTPLYTRLTTSSAGGATGHALTASLGGTTYLSATGVWVGCEGTAATAVYRLRGEFTKLTGVLGLQPHTPRSLQVKFGVVVDGETRYTTTMVRGDRPQIISVPLDGARSVTVTALATAGECAPAPAPYGAIGAASLT